MRVFDVIHDYYTLRENTLYHISPPANGDQVADASNDWMLKVSEKSPNVFSLLKPMSTDKIEYPPNTFPKCLNLLHCQISEICKSYGFNDHNHVDSGTSRVMLSTRPTRVAKKVIILWDYVVDCDFTALVLHHGNNDFLSYWKLGDKNWTPIDTKGHKIDDMILYEGKCYAVDCVGMLVSFDCKMQLTVVTSSPGTYHQGQMTKNLLVECKSDMYLVSWDYHQRRKFYHGRRKFYHGLGGYPNFEKTTADLKLVVNKLNKLNSKWDCVENLEDNVFLLGEDASVSVSTKDFEGFKGNSVYLVDRYFIEDSRSEVYGHLAGVYHLDNPKPMTISRDLDSRELNLSPPSWLMHSASSPKL